MSDKKEKWNEIIIGAIKHLQLKNDEEKKVPNHVSMQDITKLINQGARVTLKNLIESGEVTEANAMSGKYYKLKD